MTHFPAPWQLAAAQAGQIAIVALAVWLTARLLSHRRPHLVHLLWIAVLIKGLVPPLIVSPIGVFSGPRLLVAAPRAEQILQDSPRTARDAVITVSAEQNSLTRDPSDAGAGAVSTVAEKKPAAIRNSSDWNLTSLASAGWTWGRVLAWAWICGSLTFGLLAVARWRACWRRIRLGELPVDPALLDQMKSLATRIGLRRRVKLLVTEARVGPAVVGLWRPTLVLPQQITARISTAELEPILVHELMHVRRGDLWVALLQVLSRAVWWFHPLVWYANRAVSRLSEQCCDDEALAALGYPPAHYARSLLHVLELKRELQPVPAFPGVRPLEITSQRLERIMRSRHGRRRARWLDWLLLATVLVIALPGARLVGTMAGEPTEAPTPQKSLAAYLSESPKIAKPVIKVIPKTYEVADLLQTIERRFSLDRAEAQQFLQSQAIGTSVVDSKPTASWVDGKLAITQSAKQHERTQSVLEQLRKFGFDEILLEVKWIKGPPEEINRASDRWVALPQPVPAATVDSDADALGFSEDSPRTSSYAIERHPPVMFEILDADREEAVVKQFQDKRHDSLLFAPKVRVFNGQTANVLNVTQTPFVVGVTPRRGVQATAFEPQIRVCTESSQVRLRPVLKGDLVKLNYDFVFSKIGEVENVEVYGGDTPDKVTVQVPEVTTARITSQAEIPLGKTLLLGGLKLTNSEGQPESQLILVKVSRVTDSISPSAQTSVDSPSKNVKLAAQVTDPQNLIRISNGIYPKTYPVADLVIPIPEEADFSATTPAPTPQPDFETLIRRITSTIRPASWNGTGKGPGEIQPYPQNLSLVISQEEEVHEEIARLLEQMRRQLDEQVSLAIRAIPLNAFQDGDLTSLYPDEQGTRVLTGADAKRLAKAHSLLNSLKVTMFNGKSLIVPLPEVSVRDLGIPLERSVDSELMAKIRVRPSISEDHKTVQLVISLVMDTPQVAYRVDVPDGDLLVIDLSQLSHLRLKHGEQDEAGSLIPPKAAVARPPSTPQFVLICPRILIEEDDEESETR